jgi:hypothetical protein
MKASTQIAQALRTFAADVAEGFFELTHNGFALLGLAVVFATVTLSTQADLRDAGEVRLRDWLQARQVAETGAPVELDAVDRATAADPRDLPKSQAAVAYWISRKYRVAAEPVSALVAEAYDIGAHTHLEPTLILAVMAIESGFNPFAQSPVGAQGLMQVMTRVHRDKYANYGGHFAAFDPVSNLRVGVTVLQDCIKRAGSLQGGLRYYVGAANIQDDGGYAAKVMAEFARLHAVAKGGNVPINPHAAAPPPTLTTRAAAPIPVLAPLTMRSQRGAGSPLEKVASLDDSSGASDDSPVP